SAPLKLSFSGVAGGFANTGKLLEAFGLRPLALAVSLWSLRTVLGGASGIIALGAGASAVLFYFFTVQRAAPRLRRVAAGLNGTRSWLALESPPQAAARALALFAGAMGGQIETLDSEPFRRGSLVYRLGFVCRSSDSVAADEPTGIVCVTLSPSHL